MKMFSHTEQKVLQILKATGREQDVSQSYKFHTKNVDTT